MLRYLSKEEKSRSRDLYRQAFFEDSDSFIEYYYKEKIKDNKILVYEKDNIITSMVHLNPYKMKFGAKVYEIDYIVAVATDINYRRMGLMRKIIHRFLKDMYEDRKPFAFLLPANRAYYEPFDFVFVNKYENLEFNENEQNLQVVKFTDMDKCDFIEFTNQTLDSLYDIYCPRDEKYIDRYLKELKSENGFIDLYKKDNKICAYKSYWGIKKSEQRDFIAKPNYVDITYTDKEAYMCRIINLEEFVKNISLQEDSTNDKIEIHLNIEDKIIIENNGTYIWTIDKSSSILKKLSVDFDENLPKYDIATLTSYLFGYKNIDELSTMDIKVFRNIFINEVV